MSYLPAINPESRTGNHKALFDQVHAVFGGVPNMFKTIGNSPAALASMFGSFGALGKGVLDAQLGEQIAVLVADINQCEYCLAAHTVLGKNAGLSPETLKLAQAGTSEDAKTQAILTFAVKLVKNRAHITNDDVQTVRNAGCSNEEVAEILAHVALNIFTNYTNIAFNVAVDFPKVELNSAA